MQPDRRCAAVMKTDASACDRQRRHARSRTTKQSGHTRHDDRARAEEDTHAHACFMWQQYSLGPCIASLTSTPAFVPCECPQRPCREARRHASAWRRAVLDADHTAKQQHAACNIPHPCTRHCTSHAALLPEAYNVQTQSCRRPPRRQCSGSAAVARVRFCLVCEYSRANHCTRWQSFIHSRAGGRVPPCRRTDVPRSLG
jgi:hypothetical protein